MGLVVNRKVGQGVRIGPNVIVRLKDIGGGHARLYIDAPRDVEITREELLAAVKELDRKPVPAKV